MLLDQGRFKGALYRALNPVYARDPLSGRGAERYGGRFNPKGTAALYTALDPVTALREANQVGSLQPTILVSYQADLGPIFDATDGAALSVRGMSATDLSDPGWRAAMLDGRVVPTQDLATALISDGFAGIFCPSFAQGASARSFNIVLWRWSGTDCCLAVIDDENRLGRI